MNKKGLIGICGHIGVGHSHSHSGFVQDDAAGLTVAAAILKRKFPVETLIVAAEGDIYNSSIIVKTKDGGVGQVWVKKGLTPWEADMIKNVMGMDALYPQLTVLRTFGRIYGQGAMEIAVSLQAAIALALIDTFVVNYPKDFLLVDEDLPLTIGKILGTVIDIEGIPVAIMLTVNASLGGIGPIEDLEGNVMLGRKGKLIKTLGLDKTPTIIIESKNYQPVSCDSLENNTFLIRANRDYDNLVVAGALIQAADELGMEYKCDFDTLNRGLDDFSKSRVRLAEKIIEYGESFKRAEVSHRKVKLISELISILREEAGGVTFMTDSLQKSVGSAGMMKGTSAVLSLLVTRDYIEQFKIPFITDSDVEAYTRIIYTALEKLYDKLDLARAELQAKFDFKEEDYKGIYKG